MSSPDLVSTAEAADILGVSIASVTRLAAPTDGSKPKLPTYYKAPGVRGARTFRRSDVLKLVGERQAVAS